MGMLDTIMFWRKKEPDFGGMPDDPGTGGMPANDSLGLPEGVGSMDRKMPQMPSFEEQQSPESPSFSQYQKPAPVFSQTAHEQYSPKDLEVISVKLDSLRTTLDAINERLARLEKIAEGGQEFRHRF